MDGLKITNQEIKDRIAKANERYNQLLAMGWEETPNGILSQAEIKKAGFIKQNGEWKIPMEVYIATVASGGVKKGAKYLGVSMKYINWLDARDLKPIGGQQKIDSEIEKQSKVKIKRDILVPRGNEATRVAEQFGGVVVDGEIDVSKIPF